MCWPMSIASAPVAVIRATVKASCVLPAPEVQLRHCSNVGALRASLRATVALDRYPGGLGAPVEQIGGKTLTAMLYAVRAATKGAELFLGYLDGKTLEQAIHRVQAACLIRLNLSLGQGEGPAEKTINAKPCTEHAATLPVSSQVRLTVPCAVMTTVQTMRQTARLGG